MADFRRSSRGSRRPSESYAIWRPFFEWLAASPGHLIVVEPQKILAVPARHFWDPEFLKTLPGIVLADDRPGAPKANVFWASNLEEAGQVLHGYQSAWLPASLLQPKEQAISVTRSSRRLGIGVCRSILTRAWGRFWRNNRRRQEHRDEPGGARCFRVDHLRGRGTAAYPGIPGREPDPLMARRHAIAIEKAMILWRKWPIKRPRDAAFKISSRTSAWSYPLQAMC